MIFHFTIFFWSVVFFLGLETVTLRPVSLSWDWYLFSVLPLFVISLMASRRLTKRYADGFIPILLSLSAPTLLSLIDHPTQKQVFVFLGALMYYFALLGIYRLRHNPTDRTGQSFLNAAAMAGMLFFYTGMYGFYLNFSFPLWGLMALYAVGTTLASYETFIGREKKERYRVLTYSLLLGLVMGELVWAMSFWPLGYLTTGTIALILFFLAWDIAFDAFRQSLSLKKALFRIVFFIGLVMLLFFSSPWRILV